MGAGWLALTNASSAKRAVQAMVEADLEGVVAKNLADAAQVAAARSAQRSLPLRDHAARDPRIGDRNRAREHCRRLDTRSVLSSVYQLVPKFVSSC
jgi:hypothetical protein